MPVYPTSQTFNQLTTSTRSVIERAYGALKLRPQQVTSEMISIALELLLQIQSALVNDSAPLWTLNKQIIPLVQGQQQYNLGPSTVDVAQNGAFFRLMQNISSGATFTQPFGAVSLVATFPSPTQVSTIQVEWPSGSTGFPLSVYSSNSPTFVPFLTSYASTIFDPSTGNVFLDMTNNAPAQYWSISPTNTVLNPALPAGFAAQVYNTPQQIQMARLNKDDFWNLTNQAFPGRPLQWWMDRQISPIMNLWPVPDLTSSQNCMVVYRHRYLMDPGTMQQSIEFPPRWYLAIIYALAAELAFCTPEVDPQVIPQVQQKSAMMLKQAWTEERDASPIKFNVGLRQYTR